MTARAFLPAGIAFSNILLLVVTSVTAAHPQTGPVLKVTDFHVAGDGKTDDTAALQKAIDTAVAKHSTLEFPPGPGGGCYSSGSLVIRNATDVTLRGTGGILCWKGGGEGVLRTSLGYAGNLANVTIEGLEITGAGPDEMYHAGIAGPSGANLKNLVIRKNHIHDVSLGISVNADNGGTIDGFLVSENKIENVIGTPPGYGYGIHHANGSGQPSHGRIVDNTLIGCQRNSIYEAKGSGVVIANNTIINHGGGRPTPSSPLTGIQVARGNDILVTGNIIENPSDGAINVGTDSGFPIRDVTVIGNSIRNPRGVIAAFTIGSAYPANDGFPDHISVIGNDITSEGGGVIPLQINCGKEITIVGNTIHISHPQRPVSAIQVRGQQETPGSARYTDQIRIAQNDISVEGGGSAVEFTPAASASAIQTHLSGNRIDASGGPIHSASRQANSNVTMTGSPLAGHVQQSVALNGQAPIAVPGCTSATTRVQGALIGAAVRASAITQLHPDFILKGSVTAPNQVTVQFCQLYGDPTDPDGPTGGRYLIDVWPL